jgi:hypothetical protein
MDPRRTEAELQRLRESVGDSFDIYQATIPTVAIFISFVFSGLLEILLSTEALTSARLFALWFLTFSMVTFSFALVLFHAPAHRVCRDWGIFFPVSIFNRGGTLVFSAGMLPMFLCVAVLFYQRDALALAVPATMSAVGIVLFGMYFRQMHAGRQHLVNVNEASPNRPMHPTGSAGG